MPRQPIDQRQYNLPEQLMQQVLEGPLHDEMSDVYYNQVGMAGFPIFNKKLQEQRRENHEPRIPQKIVKAFLFNQHTSQTFHQYTEPKANFYAHSIAYSPFEQIQCDSMYIQMDNRTIAYVCILDLFSKYAHVTSFFLQGRVSAITSANALAAWHSFAHEMQNMGYNEQDIGRVVCDAGSEFQGAFVRYFNEHLPGKLETAMPTDKKALGSVERLNGTIRLWLTKFRFQYGHLNGHAVTQRIMNTYNNLSHSDLPLSPLQILQGNDQDRLAIRQIYEQKAIENGAIQARKGPPLPIGQHVRIHEKDPTFKKKGQSFTRISYPIAAYRRGKPTFAEFPNRVGEREWLQPINPNYTMYGQPQSTKLKIFIFSIHLYSQRTNTFLCFFSSATIIMMQSSKLEKYVKNKLATDLAKLQKQAKKLQESIENHQKELEEKCTKLQDVTKEVQELGVLIHQLS